MSDSAFPSGPARIVIVDDHEAVRAGLERLLDRAPGLAVAGAFEDGHGLPALLDERAVDVVVLDYDLERGDGLSLCLRVKQRRDPPAVAVYSGYAGPGLALAAAVAQADALVGKAEPVDALLDVLRRLARGACLLAPPTHDVRELARSRLREGDLPVMSMLLDGARAAEIARALGIDDREAMRRARRIVGVLQAGRSHAFSER